MKLGKKVEIRVIYSVCWPLTEAQQNYKSISASTAVLSHCRFKI